MLDCWAPESRRDPRLDESRQQAEKAKGQAAKENLISLANGREVIVSVPLSADGDLAKVWTMGRVLGHVWLVDQPEKSLSVQQVEAGHATKEKREELR
jgi:endonuclease YncB( thermonuclease family)